MEESEDNMSAEDIKDFDSSSVKIKPKKRSLVERELETNLTERITSPIVSDSTNTSRYGRARRLKTLSESTDSQKLVKPIKSPQTEKSPIKSPVYKMHASNSPIRVESPNKPERALDHQIETIYNENISLSRFGEDKKYTSPMKQKKVYVRKDLIQSKEKEDSITLIKHLYSPVQSSQKSSSHISNVLERSSDKFSLSYKQNGCLGNSSVVKTLDFDSNKKKNKNKTPSKSDLFDLEAQCEYQVGDLAWAKMGTYPFWPCIVTRDPYSGMFVKKKLFGRVDRDVIHVTFFGDNGRRSWIVDNMLRKFLGQLEFEEAREKFTPEARKKDPRCAAYFVSEKKLAQWTVSVEEAETLLREPKRLRIDLLNDMLNKARTVKTTPKGRKNSRADSDVSLSESLYDTLFSEEDSKSTEVDNSKTSTRKKSLDVSEVVTACLDNMAAKTGITKIQKQSHMDRWLQKAKSKTPEKSQLKSQKTNQTLNNKKNKKAKKDINVNKPFRFITSDNESLSEAENKLQSHQNEHDYSSRCSPDDCLVINSEIPGFGIITKVESLSTCSDNDLSTKINDSELIMSDDCIVAEETVVECEDFMDTNETDDLVINNVKTVQEDAVSIITISSTISKNLEDDCEVPACGSEDQTISVSKDNNTNDLTITANLDSNNEHLSDSDNLKTNECAMEETMDVSLVETEENIHSTSEPQSTLTDGLNKETECMGDVYSDNQKAINGIILEDTPIKEVTDKNELITNVCNDDVTNEDDVGKRDVNIETKILNDKLVGNNVESNKTDCINEVNEMSVDESFALNDDSDLNISETNGLENITSINDENNLMNDIETQSTIDNDKFFGNSELIENNYNTDSSQEKHVYSNKISLNIDNPLVSSVNDICSDVFYGDNTQPINSLRKDELNDDSVTSNKLKCSTSDVLSNGFVHHSDNLIETDSTFGDDERSSNSTPNSFDGFPTTKKRKKENRLRLIRKIHKRFRNSRNASNSDKTIDENEPVVDVYNTLNNKSLLTNGDITSDDTSSQTTEESERCSTESCETFNSENQNSYKHQIIFPLGDEAFSNVKEQTTEESEPSSTKSKEISKSLHIDRRTKSVETVDSMDVDESTCDTITQNGYHEPSKEDFEYLIDMDRNIMNAQVNLSKERAIMDGDELRLTPSGFEIIKDNCTKQTAEDKIRDEKDSDTLSVVSTDSEASMKFDAVQNDQLRNSNIEIEPIERSKSTLPEDNSNEEVILNRDDLRLTPSDLNQENETKKDEDVSSELKVKEEDAASVVSTDSEVSLSKRKMRWKVEKQSGPEKKTAVAKNMEDPEFLKYLELKQDELYDEYPDFSQEDITSYLYNTWLYEQSLKTDSKKIDDIESAKMVKGLQSETQHKEVKKRNKVKKEKDYESIKEEVIIPKQKPKRRTVRPSYNEEYSDIESDLEVFSIFKPTRKEIQVVTKTEAGSGETGNEQTEIVEIIEEEEIDEVEEYFAQLAEPKPNVFKGLLRERVCDICEKTGNLVKCKGCSCMFHVNCVNKETEVVEAQAPIKGRKKKKKHKSRKSKSDENGLDESHSDDKDANVSEEIANTSTDNIEPESHIVADADEFEAKLAIKMKELLGEDDTRYDSFSSNDELDWSDIEAGKCEVVDIKLRKRSEQELIDYSDFKCNNCQKYDVPICFVCRSAESPKNSALHRQKCQVAQCNTYYHLECLEHWPQTQFNSGETAKYNKKVNEYFESLTCPRHVCHTCVSDDPRGCKTRFCGDKLAKCVRCPATYHSFTRCLPAGSQILTGSHIICPRHYEHRPGKVPCHVNTGWCFICALGGTLICCEYCPTSFHAECLNIKPPEGSYMCEDCETGRLPLYGEMVWVKLGHYRWWPGIILHPCEIPENIMAVKHSQGEFVVRFFGQYDHYWVNRGRVFPFQEGDSGKVSSQKSKIDAAFTMAMEHASRACEILKNAAENEEESLDIASSLLPPHYVKLRTNKPCGALCGRRVEPQEGSLTQCECSPLDEQPCGPYSHCLNRMLLTECGPTCRAGDRCNNRAFEKRQYPKLVPYRTPHRGWGLKTLEDIKAGQFVIEYVGELIDEEEFQRRMRRKHEIRDENFYFLTLDKERMIDAGPKGNLARFMNHCCEPNCETQKWTVLGDVRVGLFALYDIPANSEVTFNYNLESAGIEKKRCLCGAKRCSGYIGAKPKQLQTDQPKKVKPTTGKRPYNKKKKVEESPTTSKVKPKPKLGRPPKPKELTEIEKDLLIIKNATNGISSDSDCSVRLTSIDASKEINALKRKRVDFSTEEPSCSNSSPSKKKVKLNDEQCIEICD